METKHTPIPYYVAESGGGYAIRVSSFTLGKPIHYDVTVAVLSYDPITEPQAKETAEFIVRACNSHDELLEALKRLLRHGAGSPWLSLDDEGVARAAIAKATNS